MKNQPFDLDALNKAITRIRKSLKVYSKEKYLIEDIINWKDVIVLLGRREYDELTHWSYNSSSSGDGLFDATKEFFGLTILKIDSDSCFELVFTIPEVSFAKPS